MLPPKTSPLALLRVLGPRMIKTLEGRIRIAGVDNAHRLNCGVSVL